MGKKGKRSNKTMTKTARLSSSRLPIKLAKKITNPKPDVLRYIQADSLSQTIIELANAETIIQCSALFIRQHSMSSLQSPYTMAFNIAYDEAVSCLQAIRFLRAEATRDTHPYNTKMNERKASEPVLEYMNGSIDSFTIFLRLVAASKILLSMYGIEYVAPFVEEACKQLKLWESEWTQLLSDTDDKSIQSLELPENFTVQEVGYVLGELGCFLYRAIFYQSQRPGGLQGGEGGSVAISTSSPQQHWKRCVKFAKLAVRCGATLSPPKSKGNLDMTWCYSSGCSGSSSGRANFVTTAKHAQLAIEQADLSGDNYVGAVARWELASAIMFGAEGRKFKRGRVAKLMIAAEKCEAELKKWNQKKRVDEGCAGNTMVIQFIKLDSKGVNNNQEFLAREFPGQRIMHDNSGKSSTSSSGTRKSNKEKEDEEGAKIGSLEQPCLCDGCGRHFKKVKKCGRCGIASYHASKCQKKHWKEHKLVCFDKTKEKKGNGEK
tara:strand:+ start:61 stop:1533 length:1473 start_codon:yes stop_codon:yes gene_type:complete